MDWSKASSHYQILLKTALNVQRHALCLADIKSAGVKPELRQSLLEGIEPVKRQLGRLEKGEFRIAVVGLEKSGKSTFVNAWLESDLLPTASKRCTYTTTQIYSVTDKIEQRIEVIAKSRDNFDNYLEELNQASKENNETAKRAREDLDTIQEYISCLEAVVVDGNKTIHFTDIQEIAHHLKKYVADVSVAHAIEEVRLYTTRLAETDGIVFFDVPGLNSGLGKHLEESKNMLADCDAVICVQNSRQPSLEAHEQKLVGFVSEGDEAVGIAGKLFVFAGQVDLLGTSKQLNENYHEICKEWDKRGKLPSDHIVLGSAGAFLLLSGSAGDEIRSSIGEINDVRHKIATVKEISDSAPDKEIIESTGIRFIRDRIKKYLNEERVSVLKKRCDEPVKRIIEASSEIYRTVRHRFSENPDDVRRQAENRHNIQFQEWWSKRWSEIEPAVNRFFKEHFDPENRGEEETESIKEFRIRYQQLIQEGLSQLPALNQQRRQDIFDKESRPVFDPLIVNDAWRKILYDNDINKFLYTIAEKLSSELLKDCEKFVDYMSSQLWDSSEVKKYILDETQLRLQLESGLRSLFLRFARPVAESLVRGPLASERRKEIVRKLGCDIELVDNYYEGDDPAFEYLKRYVKYGKSLTDDPVVRQIILNIYPEVALGMDLANKTMGESIKPQPAKTEQEVIEEVESDIKTLEKYLTEVVFTAAGFASYLSQELKRLRDQFASLSHIWAGVTINEYESENPKLLNKLPEELKNPVFDVEISERLRQLRLALEDTKIKDSYFI
ncbi:MAG: dynamin family protein [Desulfamplus sp.]|nr:dynamin family protein [Desulfamplus sp.]